MSHPRLRLGSVTSRDTLLDGGWWPRSTDPFTELPGLVAALDSLRGPITRLVLSADGWDAHPKRMTVDDRVVNTGFFATQPATLLTARRGDRTRVDLLVVPPDTAPDVAEAAMRLAATASHRIHAQRILATLVPGSHDGDAPGREAWETDGGSPAAVQALTGQSLSMEGTGEVVGAWTRGAARLR